MQAPATSRDSAHRRHRPRTLTVFAAAFAAGAVLAYGVDRVVDIHVVQVEPQVESEPIFVALRSLPQGSPVTIWDVALKDWPKAMLPTTALKADATFDGMVLRHPIREGQPLLSVQLVRDGGPAPGTAVATLPPLTAPVAEPSRQPAGGASAAERPSATERFVPATPAAAAVPTEVAAVEAAPPAPTSGHSAAETADASAPPARIADEFVAAAPTATPGTDIDPPAVAPAEPAPADVVAAADPVAVPVTETEVPAPAAETVAVAEAVIEDAEMATPALMEPTPAAPAATGNDPLAVLAVAAPVPLAAPLPALPSTDIGGALAEVGRAHLAAQPPVTSVLDRTTEAEPPHPAQQLPKQHLVIPERIALAADASFTQRPQPQPSQPAEQQPAAAASGESVRTSPPPVRMPPTDAAATARVGGRRPGAAAQPTARQPARNPRQPAAKLPPPATKPQSPAARFWNAWFPPAAGGSRQR